MLDVILGISAIVFGKNVIKSTLNVVDQTVPDLIKKSAHASTNLIDLCANATESLPTFGLSVAANHLLDMEKELSDFNSANGTTYSSYREIVDKYKKIGG